MNKLQQQLIKENEKEIIEIKKKVKSIELEVKKSKAELKVEEKFFNDLKENNDSDMKDIVKYAKVNVIALKELLITKQAELKELKIKLEALELKQPILKRSSWGF